MYSLSLSHVTANIVDDNERFLFFKLAGHVMKQKVWVGVNLSQKKNAVTLKQKIDLYALFDKLFKTFWLGFFRYIGLTLS